MSASASGAAPRPTFLSPSLVRFGVVALFVYAFLFNFSVVRGNSMAPNILDGDHILVDHLSYLVADVQRGDIVVLRCPIDPSVDYIKRVVGLPGDEIAIEGGRIWVNGELFEEPWAVYPDARASFHTLVGEEHAFVLGDNRPRSSDSREFGSIPLALVRGKVELRVWPLARAGRI